MAAASAPAPALNTAADEKSGPSAAASPLSPTAASAQAAQAKQVEAALAAVPTAAPSAADGEKVYKASCLCQAVKLMVCGTQHASERQRESKQKKGWEKGWAHRDTNPIAEAWCLVWWW
jgi:hypothetical protein